MTKISSWGMFPEIQANVFSPVSNRSIQELLKKTEFVTPRGNGKSYGDSALGENIVCSSNRDHLIHLDRQRNILKVQSGVTLDSLLPFLVPQGYFLPVVPGTKYITVGGAIASDIHGKNHHKDGTFTDYVSSITLINSSGESIACSREDNSDLFYATCGGMGLTGFIQAAEFSLKTINSNQIRQTSHKARNIDELFELFELYHEPTYSVAWIDCLGSKNLGRGILMTGEHDHRQASLRYRNVQIPIPVPMMPTWVLSPFSIQAFNFLYFHKTIKQVSQQKIPIDAFFFPLDKLKTWNHLYGKSGFTQYQFVVPKKNGREGIKKILKKISDHKNASFLAVLKLFGKANENYLSFPIEGYTLALDFKLTPELFLFLHQLNEIVIEHGGRVYLTKDVCMLKEHFERMYGDRIEIFQRTREKYNAMKFQSIQSRRLGL
jgi:decaprenylphospho-beta-D-ribofuranose 2-oxidase